MDNTTKKKLRTAATLFSAFVAVSIFIPGTDGPFPYAFINPYQFIVFWCAAVTVLFLAPLWHIASKKQLFSLTDFLYPVLPYFLWVMLVMIESPGHEGFLELPVILILTVLLYAGRLFFFRHMLIVLLILTAALRLTAHTATVPFY